MSWERLYCGCCGNPIGANARTDNDWCSRCRPHIARARREVGGCFTPVWERTYFAQTGEDCPWQVTA